MGWGDVHYCFAMAILVVVYYHITGLSFALMNPNIFTSLVLAFHDLDEFMSVLCFEKDNLLSLTNVCKTYILNTKQIQIHCNSRKL